MHRELLSFRDTKFEKRVSQWWLHSCILTLLITTRAQRVNHRLYHIFVVHTFPTPNIDLVLHAPACVYVWSTSNSSFTRALLSLNVSTHDGDPRKKTGSVPLLFQFLPIWGGPFQ